MCIGHDALECLGVFCADTIEGIWQRVWDAHADPLAVVDLNAVHLPVDRSLGGRGEIGLAVIDAED